ncbi:MAG: DUF2961 domain-containing protein [Planctomycetes bacterium]|nr:DUF2961 domain-containing protein [Planctomycetota bacterium]
MRRSRPRRLPSLLAVLAPALGAVAQAPSAIPVGYDAWLQWERWPQQRIGARAYMRSTYDRHGNNEHADASHFLYQEREDFNVTLDVEGAGMLYFARYNHWHGSPWHYEVDGVDHRVAETTTADPLRPRDDAVFLPRAAFPAPLTATYAETKGADLSWIPIGFGQRFRMAYSRTYYGTGYYIYHRYLPGAVLSQPLVPWQPEQTPPAAVLALLRAAGTDIAPAPDDERGIVERRSHAKLAAHGRTTLAELDGSGQIRMLALQVPRADAVDFGRVGLRITWDDREQPSIDAPVALFFGAGTLYNRDGREWLVRALPVNIRYTDRRVELCCYLPMPFFERARIELVNPTARTFDAVDVAVRSEPLRADRGEVGQLHATYVDHAAPRPGHDLVFLDTAQVEGGGPWSGSFIGTSFIFSHDNELRTLEGDPRFFFDDSRTPQCYGTGTEEWGGGGDYWGGRMMTLPLVGHPVGKPRGTVNDPAAGAAAGIESAYRFLLADLMPFGRRAVIRFEHGGTNEYLEHYESVTYWYGSPAATLVPTDRLDVGDVASERAHDYSSPDASPPYELTSRFECGPDRIALPRGRLRAEPVDAAEFEFDARSGVPYHIWLRGRTAGDLTSDAVWLQFDDEIGTTTARAGGPKGFGNWRDDGPTTTFTWSSELPASPPRTVTFARDGRHRLRLQTRHGPHQIDRIWLSATQRDRPAAEAEPATADGGEIVLTPADATALRGAITRRRDGGRELLEVGAGDDPGALEVFAAETLTGRRTTTTSEFTLRLRADNHGVLLRRTLDYGYPNQRAHVSIAAPESDEWHDAGMWYLAGSNTCYLSYPSRAAGGELGPTNPVVQTSNRRLRDDEFLLPLEATRGRDAIRVRIEFVPDTTPLLPGRALAERAWTELEYRAYCYVLPR